MSKTFLVKTDVQQASAGHFLISAGIDGSNWSRSRCLFRVNLKDARVFDLKGKRAAIPARIACGLKLKSEAKMRLQRSDPVLRNRRPNRPITTSNFWIDRIRKILSSPPSKYNEITAAFERRSFGDSTATSASFSMVQRVIFGAEF